MNDDNACHSFSNIWRKLRHSAWRVESLCVDNWTMYLKSNYYQIAEEIAYTNCEIHQIVFRFSFFLSFFFFFSNNCLIKYWWVELLLFNRPTVQEDGGDILFKVCRKFVFYVQIGHMVYRNDARLLELQKFNFRWVINDHWWFKCRNHYQWIWSNWPWLERTCNFWSVALVWSSLGGYLRYIKLSSRQYSPCIIMTQNCKKNRQMSVEARWPHG